jgi:AdoMet-dependent rRNA methyltransferase SPB1
MRQIDAQPIKKILEAKGRARKRIMRKVETMKRKAAIIADSEDMGERQKSEQIQKMIAKANKPQKKETKLVIARGSNKGVKGRPKGTKGHYKMVDNRLKKDMKAKARIDNKKKGKRSYRK